MKEAGERWPRLPAMAGRTIAALVGLVFVLANAVNALNKGGDAADFFEGGRRLLAGLPLYDGSGPASGFIGPPFQALFFAPFALLADLNATAAKLLWYAINLAALALGVLLWSSVCRRHLPHDGSQEITFTHHVMVPLVAVLLPLQTNFEHQNMNTLLLGVLGAGVWYLVRNVPTVAGVFFGFAAALKAFPALIVVYLAMRSRKAFAWAMLTAVVLSSLPIAVYGAGDFAQHMRAWARISSGGWPVRANNQSLVAALDRAWPGTPPEGVSTQSDRPAVYRLFILSGAFLAAVVVRTIVRRRERLERVALEVSLVLLFAVLMSPIAWDHYWVLLFPAFLLAYVSVTGPTPDRPGMAMFVTATILTSGISPMTVGNTGWQLARACSSYTIAALVLLAALARANRSTPNL